MRPFDRKLPVGAEIAPGGGVHFRLWAPECQPAQVLVEDPQAETSKAFALELEAGGYFAALVPEAGAGTRYRYRLDGAEELVPDPASRFQPAGLEGPSQVVDPSTFHWTDTDWNGVR